jgi:hypothetical protein
MRLDSRLFVGVIAVTALLLIAAAYWPGLNGPFLFDDYGNLDVLGAYGQVNNWRTFAYYITSGTADPIGRPLALLTFLLDANTWPAQPWPFKRTNLVLHLINTALLALVIARLEAGLQRRRPDPLASPWIALLAATLWGAHPFFVSTTLYVVQREAMLPTTFVFLALLAWDRAVACFLQGRDRAAWSWAIAGFGGATLLAGLSKANGFLAPLLAGLVYLFFLRPDPRLASGLPRAAAVGARWSPMDKCAALCLAFPTLLVFVYLLQVGWHLWSVPYITGREWTLPERLLSEPRALWSYLLQLAIPRAGGGGLYVDNFAASRGWLEPATTLPATLGLLASVIAAIRFRRHFPIACFAWLFFLAAHILESSTIPLELYFEHRNYLPAAFFGWPLAHWLLRPGGHGKARATLAAVILGGLLLLTNQRALVWGNETLLSALWGEHQTDSPRSQVIAARAEMARGDFSAALSRIHAMQRSHAESVDIAINAIGFECQGPHGLAPDTLARARYALLHATSWNYGLYEWMKDAARDAALRNCRGFGLAGLKALVDSAESNPQTAAPTRKRELWHVRGRIALAANRPTIALQWFDAALMLRPDPQYALVQAAALGDAGAQTLGVQHLDHYARMEAAAPSGRFRDMAAVHAWLLQHYGYYRTELLSLRQRLQADAVHQTDRGTAPQ